MWNNLQNNRINNITVTIPFLMMIFVMLFGFTKISQSTTIDDISVISSVTLESTNLGYSSNITVNPVDKVPHIVWCKEGNIYHVYRQTNGNWSSPDVIPESYYIYSVDEDEDLLELRKPQRNVGIYFDQIGVFHLAFADSNGGVYYMKKTNGTWSTPQQVCQTSILKVHVNIVTFGTKMYVAYEEGWHDELYTVEWDGTSWKTPVYMGGGEFPYLLKSRAGNLYFWARGKDGGRNTVFAYLRPGDTSWTFASKTTDALNASNRLGAGPHTTVSDGNLYMVWPYYRDTAPKEEKSAVYCATAPEPGATWTSRTTANPLFYAETGDPFPRIATYADNTVIIISSRRKNTDLNVYPYYLIFDGTSWSEKKNTPFIDTITEIASDGETVWAVSLGLSKTRPNWLGPVTVTGFKNTNQLVTNLDPPVISHAELVPGENRLKITFSEVPGATHYNIYRDTLALFEPDLENFSNRIAAAITDQDPQQDGIQWTTNPVLGDKNVNYFWVATACAGTVESDHSNTYGEFDYQLLTTATTDFNEIALPLVCSGINRASELNNIITGCNSVARWDPAGQGYIQYIDDMPFTDYDVYPGYPYFVNVTSSSVLTLHGEIVEPVFNLVTTSTTSFNDIMLPLQKSSISSAADLMTDILNCNSIASWDAGSQGYMQYIDYMPFTNFKTKAGYPYLVHVTAGSSWPSSGLLKNSISDIEAKNLLTKVPHAVYGQLKFNDQTLGFTAFVENRPDEKLTEKSPGCLVKDSKYLIQVSSLASSWKIGDKLNIEFSDGSGKTIGRTGVVLSSNAFDRVDEYETIMNNLPVDYQLSQNYPNPFNPETLISFSLPTDGHVSLVIYNTMGQKIRTLVNEKRNAGTFSVMWQGNNDSGLNVSSGTYILVLKSGEIVLKRKAVLLR